MLYRMSALMSRHADRRNRVGTVHGIRETQHLVRRIIVIRQFSPNMLYPHVINPGHLQDALRRLRARQSASASYPRIFPVGGVNAHLRPDTQHGPDQHQKICGVKIKTVISVMSHRNLHSGAFT